MKVMKFIMKKNRIFLFALFVLLANAGCASEMLHVKVVDNNGKPISNAIVKVSFSAGHVVFAKGKSYKYESNTDEKGLATVEFNCKSSDIWWHVEADGYYRGNTHKEIFKGENVLIPPGFGFWKVYEHEKQGSAILWRKINPQPMIVHGVAYQADQRLFPQRNGRYGFDLVKFDWLPPLGNGEVADFYLVRKFGEEVSDGVVGYLEFQDKCGLYKGVQTGCKAFPSVYEANTNGIFESRVPFIFNRTDDGRNAITYKDIARDEEYCVLRTRVVCDEYGKIVSANYSKILGPFRVAEAYKGWVLYTPSAVFNPRVNDPNLESDPARSYDPRVKRPSIAP